MKMSHLPTKAVREGSNRITLPALTNAHKKEFLRLLDMWALNLQEGDRTTAAGMEVRLREVDLGFRPRNGGPRRGACINSLVARHPNAEKLMQDYFNLLYQYGVYVQDGKFDGALSARNAIIVFIERLVM
jgi:hypothetical protein